MRKSLAGQDQTRPLSSPSSAYPQGAHHIVCLCSQIASEKSELLEAHTEYEKDITLLESLYNDNKELLDQHKLDTDLKELAE